MNSLLEEKPAESKAHVALEVAAVWLLSTGVLLFAHYLMHR